MYYGNIKKTDIADGPGVRVTLFVSGCTHHCRGCFQPETWDFKYGRPYTAETEAEILQALSPGYIAGLTLLGGEPFEPENQRVLLGLLRKVRETLPEKNIWSYSGYRYEELMSSWDKDMTFAGGAVSHAGGSGSEGGMATDPASGQRPVCEVTSEMLSLIDVLVDGEFIEERKNIMLRFRGSENQRIIDLRKTENAGEIVLWQ